MPQLAIRLGWMILLMSVSACTVASRESEIVHSATQRFAELIESAHGLAAWQNQKAIQADITVNFGGKTYLSGTMLFDTSVGRVRMELANGTVLGFDGQDAWIFPTDATHPSARFDLFTWPYFVAVPMKLRDPGTHLTDLSPLLLHQQPFPTAKLTFDSGVGDSPEDWYILYRHPNHHRLVTMAYIVTFGGKNIEEAEKEPHAITYAGFKTFDGVVISTIWKFWLWDRDQGVHGKALGQAVLSQIRFVQPAPDAFVMPANARVAP